MMNTSVLLTRYRIKDELIEGIDPPKQITSSSRFFNISIYALNFAIVHRINDVVIFIVNFYRSHKLLSQETTSKKLTPLHLAVIAGNVEAGIHLLKAGAQVNAQDKYKWTPLHHAALQSNQVFINILLQAGANPAIQSLLGGTYLDLYRSVTLGNRDPDDLIPLYWEDEGGKQEQLTLKKFSLITNAVYIQESLLSTDIMIDQWHGSKKPEYYLPFEKKFNGMYDNFLSSRPAHLMKKVLMDSEGKRLERSPGFGLFARTDFRAGDLIGDLIGQWGTHWSKPSAYTLGFDHGPTLDGLEYRNELSQINESFPNIVLVPGRSLKGLSHRNLFAAIEPIKVGQQFCWNYGFSESRMIHLPHVELRPREMREFINKHDDIDKLDRYLYLDGTGKATFEQYILAEQFRYILENPASIFLMIFDESITLEKGKKLTHLVLSRGAYYTERTAKLLQRLPVTAEICLSIKKNSIPFLREKYEKLIETLPGKAGLFFTLFSINDFNARLADTLIELGNQSTQKSTISEQELLDMWDRLEIPFSQKGAQLAETFVEKYRHRTAPLSYDTVD